MGVMGPFRYLYKLPLTLDFRFGKGKDNISYP